MSYELLKTALRTGDAVFYVAAAAAFPLVVLFFMNNVLRFAPAFSRGNDKTMLSFRKRNAISSYTKFALGLQNAVDMPDAVRDIRARIEEMLKRDR